MNRAVDNRYKIQARLMLQNSFQHISCAAIDSALSTSDFKFNDAFHFLSNVEAQRDATDGHGAGAFDGIPPQLRVFLRRERPRIDITLTERDERLRGEIDAIPELNTKEEEVIDLTSDTEDEDSIVVEDVKEPEVECLCCFGDYAPSEMRECQPGSGHRVCKECIYRYVSEQLDGNDSASFTCIVDTNCQNLYSLSLLDQVLSPKLNKRANDRVFREEMKRAGIKSWTCPHCAYIGFNGYSEHIPWIECPECSIQYCTKCNEVFHKGKTCDDVRKEKDRERDPKRLAHEAMTQACKRFCPHCAQEYQKGGANECNKITCKCKGFSCYLCGEKIGGYEHFCRHPLDPGTACTCGKCRLFTSAEEMGQIERTKRQEAGRKALAEAGVADEKEILSILASPPKKAALGCNAKAPAGPAVVPAPVLQPVQAARAPAIARNVPAGPPARQPNVAAAPQLAARAPVIAQPQPVRAPVPNNGAGQPANVPVRPDAPGRGDAGRLPGRNVAGLAVPVPQAPLNLPVPPAPPAAQMPAVPDGAGLHLEAFRQGLRAARLDARAARQGLGAAHQLAEMQLDDARRQLDNAVDEALEDGQCVIQ